MLGAAAIMNVVGHFVRRVKVAGMSMTIVLQYGVPLLMAFKVWQTPRGYVRDLAFWYAKTAHAYCALARDREIRSALSEFENFSEGNRRTRLVFRRDHRSAPFSRTCWLASWHHQFSPLGDYLSRDIAS